MNLVISPPAMRSMFLLVSNFGVAIQIALLGEQHLSGCCVFVPVWMTSSQCGQDYIRRYRCSKPSYEQFVNCLEKVSILPWLLFELHYRGCGCHSANTIKIRKWGNKEAQHSSYKHYNCQCSYGLPKPCVGMPFLCHINTTTPYMQHTAEHMYAANILLPALNIKIK